VLDRLLMRGVGHGAPAAHETEGPI
jgi:hypothetical protein